MVAQTDVRGIHHPRGSWKRISFGDKTSDFGSRPDPNNFPSCEDGTAHRIRYAEGNGRTQPGSSGSPLLDTSAHVRGVLSCGDNESCDGAQHASYGKIEHIWDSLAPYVDPPDPVYVDTDFGGARRGTVVGHARQQPAHRSRQLRRAVSVGQGHDAARPERRGEPRPVTITNILRLETEHHEHN
jgi:hypothetical protein